MCNVNLICRFGHRFCRHQDVQKNGLHVWDSTRKFFCVLSGLALLAANFAIFAALKTCFVTSSYLIVTYYIYYIFSVHDRLLHSVLYTPSPFPMDSDGLYSQLQNPRHFRKNPVVRPCLYKQPHWAARKAMPRNAVLFWQTCREVWSNHSTCNGESA